MADLNKAEQDRLNALQAKPVSQQTPAEKSELAALINKRDNQ